MGRTSLGSIVTMEVDDYDSLILYVGDLSQARAFYADTLGLPVRFGDEIIVVVGGPSGQIVLHRNDRGQDDRGIFPAGTSAGAASIRFNVGDPKAWEGRDEAVRCACPVAYPGGPGMGEAAGSRLIGLLGGMPG